MNIEAGAYEDMHKASASAVEQWISEADAKGLEGKVLVQQVRSLSGVAQ